MKKSKQQVAHSPSAVTSAPAVSSTFTKTRRFIDNGNGTITDTSTGLIWQQRDDGRERNWHDAINYCNQLNLGGSNRWRLPEIDELKYLIDSSRSPTIDPVFIDTKSSYYWSASSEGFPNRAWYVVFSGGYVNDYSKASSYYVRCVR